MPAPIVIRNLTPETKKAANPGPDDPLIATKADLRDGSRAAVVADPQGVIFQESFDDQPDWHSELPENDKGYPDGKVDYQQYAPTHVIPEDWTAARQQGRWNPDGEFGQTDRPPVMELASHSNPNKMRGGTGKSLVKWRHSYAADGVNAWSSDGLLVKYLGGDFSEVYVEFYVNFSDEVIQTFYADKLGMSKMVRIISHDDPTNGGWIDYFRFFGIYNKPIAIWDYKGGLDYGIQNAMSLYRYSDGVTTNPDINEHATGSPRSLIKGNTTANYSPTSIYGTTGQGLGGTTPELTDYKNGGTIDSGPVMMDQVFGDETQWVKMGFYVKMCSAPGEPDGEWMQFIDDQRVMHIYNIPWIPPHAPMKLWNMVIFGGNDNFTGYPDSERHVEWYSFDDITIRDGLPDHLKEPA